MSIQKLRSGRVPTATASTYVGEGGTIFWNASTGEFRLSDGITPGGSRVGFPVASATEIGGIKLGPGVTLNGQAQLIIDNSGLEFSFGDFYSFTNTGPSDGACLSSVNENQDVNIVTNGTGMINIVGEFHIHKTNNDVEGALSVDPIFEVNADGQMFIRVPTTDSTFGAVEIVGSTTGTSIAPGLSGAMLHVTGQLGVQNRLYFDGNGGYVALNGRRWNGSIAEGRTQVKANDDVLRINATAQTDTTMPSIAIAQIALKALEDQTDTAQGSKIEFVVTPLGQSASTRLTGAMVDATGTTSIRFFGPLTGDVTGNVSGSSGSCTGNAATVTNGVVTTGSYANPAWITSLAASKVGLGNVENTALSTSTHYIGTTSITYNRASASQTLTGVSIDGNAGTVTNGVVTTGSYSDPSWLTISKSKVGLGSVENTALSTWAGTTNITTVGTLTSLTLAAGTTTVYPLKFTAGIPLTTPQTGEVGYNGTVFYATPIDAERGLIITEQKYILNADRSLTNDTNPQSLFGVGFHVTAGTRYRYQILCTITKTGGNTVSIGYGLLVNSGGALSRHTYRAESTAGATALTPTPINAMRNSITTNFATPVDFTGALVNGASGSTINIQGALEVTTSGYVTPQVTFLNNAPTGATLSVNATIRVYPVGPTGANTNIGNWA